MHARFVFAVILVLLPGVVHGECIMAKYEIHGTVTNSDESFVPAVVEFSWEEGSSNTTRHLAASTDAGTYSAVLYFDPQSKAEKTSGRIYDCDAVLTAVRYQIAAPNGNAEVIRRFNPG